MTKIDKTQYLDAKNNSSNWKVKDYNLFMRKIEERCNKIVRTIHKNNVVWWDFENTEDDYLEFFDFRKIDNSRGGWISFYVETEEYREVVIIDKDGDEIGLNEEFPERWLYEDFEEEFKDGLKRYKFKLEEDKKERAEKYQQKKKKKAEMKKNITNKLTKEELKYIKFK